MQSAAATAKVSRAGSVGASVDGSPGDDALERATAELRLVASSLVGINPMLDAQLRFKRAMLMAALSRVDGNLTKAAHLLGVKRQAVQQLIERFELRQWAAMVRLGSAATGHERGRDSHPSGS